MVGTVALRLAVTVLMSHPLSHAPAPPTPRCTGIDKDSRSADFLRSLHTRFPKPRAVLVVSAHWEASTFTVQTHPSPPLLYDYGGFPEESYHVKYPAPGAPELAERVTGLLTAAGMEVAADRKRGFDHGVFVPFTLMYAAAASRA